MLAKNTLKLFLLFFMQPVFIIGLLYAWWNRSKRIKYVRKNYRLNFNPSPFEIFDYLFKLLLVGALISIITVALGVPLTIEWYIIYQLVTVFLLLVSGSRFIHPLFTFSLTSIGLFIFSQFDIILPMDWLQDLLAQNSVKINFESSSLSALILNSLVYLSIILIFTGYMMKKKDENKFYPILHASKRGKTVAKYQNKPLLLLPLIMVVPGNMIEPFASWWPLFNLGGERYALLLLPVLIGFHFTISTQLLGQAIKSMKKDLRILTIVSFVLAGISYFYMEFSIFAVGIVLIGGLFVLYRHRQREQMWNFKYGPADEGLRVIAIRPKSPAERMGLGIGVIITHINDIEMTTKEDFYETMSYNRSYIKMRLRRTDGEIMMVETPLYDDDFNNLGVLILKE